MEIIGITRLVILIFAVVTASNLNYAEAEKLFDDELREAEAMLKFFWMYYTKAYAALASIEIIFGMQAFTNAQISHQRLSYDKHKNQAIDTLLCGETSLKDFVDALKLKISSSLVNINSIWLKLPLTSFTDHKEIEAIFYSSYTEHSFTMLQKYYLQQNTDMKAVQSLLKNTRLHLMDLQRIQKTIFDLKSILDYVNGLIISRETKWIKFYQRRETSEHEKKLLATLTFANQLRKLHVDSYLAMAEKIQVPLFAKLHFDLPQQYVQWMQKEILSRASLRTIESTRITLLKVQLFQSYYLVKLRCPINHARYYLAMIHKSCRIVLRSVKLFGSNSLSSHDELKFNYLSSFERSFAMEPKLVDWTGLISNLDTFLFDFNSKVMMCQNDFVHDVKEEWNAAFPCFDHHSTIISLLKLFEKVLKMHESVLIHEVIVNELLLRPESPQNFTNIDEYLSALESLSTIWLSIQEQLWLLVRSYSKMYSIFNFVAAKSKERHPKAITEQIGKNQIVITGIVFLQEWTLLFSAAVEQAQTKVITLKNLSSKSQLLGERLPKE